MADKQQPRPDDPQGQVDAIVAEVQATAARVREQQRSALSATGTASSQDGAVRAVVDATGVVTSLELARSVFERNTPDKLARTVVATIQAAARQARAQLNSTLESMRAPHEGVLAKAAEGVGRLGVPDVGVPEVPSTAVDPTGYTDSWQQPPPPEVRQPPREVRAPEAYAASADDAEEDYGHERPW